MRFFIITACLLIRECASLEVKYEGCYSDQVNILITRGYFTPSKYLTPSRCIVHCISQGFRFAGVKKGVECYCGDLPQNDDGSISYLNLINMKYCGTPCSGHNTMTCGGEHAIEIYSTGIEDMSYDDAKSLEIGCFNDNGAKRTLPHHKMDFIRTNSPQLCVSYCKSLGYTLAGVQYRIECHCGYTMPIMNKSDGCNLPCAANPQLSCGGYWRIMVYQIKPDVSEINTEFHLDGCYKMDGDDDKMNKFTTVKSLIMTYSKCVAHCSYHGFLYANIYEGNTCTCQSDAPNKEKKVSLSTCSIPCPGNQNQKCGGLEHMITYKTGAQGDVSVGKLLGCFRDKENTLITGVKFDFGRTCTASACISICFQYGYEYAGIRDTTECLCSHMFPAKAEWNTVSDYRCSSPCPGNALQSCGSYKHLLLYRTGIRPNLDANHSSQQTNLKEMVAMGQQEASQLGVGIHQLSKITKKESLQVTDDTQQAGQVEPLKREEEHEISNSTENLISDKENLVLREGILGEGFFGYIGCFLDLREEIKLTAERRSSETTMSIQQCNIFCFSKGYQFSATRRGNECYCEDLNMDMLSTPDDDRFCSSPCLSDSNKNCGGPKAFTIYSTGIQEDKKEDVSKLKVGCLIDRGDSRLIKEHKAELTKTNTPKRCIAYCRVLGYPNAGVQHGSQCFCGKTARDRPLMNSCDSACPGDPTQTCGGNWRLELYSTGTTLSAQGQMFAGYLGCFGDQREEIILSKQDRTTGDSMTIPQCNVYCFLHGYAHAATTNGNQCVCVQLKSDTLPSSDDDEFCSSNCNGDQSTRCGGPKAYTIHSTGTHEKELGEIEKLRIGCLQDANTPRLLKEHRSYFSSTNTPRLCVAYCTALGYPQAGVQYGLECYCGITGKTSPKVEGCDLPCTGNPEEKCGGHWLLDTYATMVSEAVFQTEDEETTIQERHSQKLQAGYLGCYKADRNDVVVRSEQRVTERTMTINQCISYCYIKGYKHAATKNGNECTCGDLSEDNVPKPDSDKLCDSPCLSDEISMCGGKDAYTIYSTGIQENDIGDISKLRITCLNDTDEIRLIEEHKADFFKTNTPSRCVAYCKSLGYSHAGMQYGIECFCGTPRRLSPNVEECEVPCAGDTSINCGGHWKLEVYKTGVLTDYSDFITLSGCFVYNEDAVLTRTTIADMTPNKCIAYCFRQGLPYAHIFNGVECLCGRKVNDARLRVSVSKCNMTCKGDPNNICGAEAHMLTYTTGVKGNPILGRQVSCYQDDDDKLIDGPRFNLGLENSIELCMSRCIEAGYPFAGLKNTQECFCSQTAPKRSLYKMVSTNFCDQPCPRAELQSCGGSRFILLFRTGIVPVIERVLGKVTPGYLGCFKDSKNEVRLTGDQETVRTLTVRACNNRCFRLGFKHSATRNGKECYCGDLNGPIPDPDEEKFCNVQCSSDITVNCGGRDAYSVYSTGITDDDLVNLDELEIGCLRDSDDIRLLPEHKVDLTLTNSPKRCIAYCRALGYPHAGMQYSIECHCGMARKTYPLDEGCDKTCSGDPESLCGGDWKANVYSTGITRAPPGISPRGCFSYNSTLISGKKTIPKMDPNKCIAHCFTQRQSFAFLHNGFDCLCGPKLPSNKFRSVPRNCDIVCPNDGNSRCGGIDFMSAYSTGVIVDPSLGKMVGCYKDDNNDLMTGKKLNLGQQNGVVLCTSTCIEGGYAYAALRNTNECQCSQTAPKRTPVRIVPDYECASPCPLNNLESCGAPLFTAIYRTGLIPVKLDEQCPTSSSRINGKSACGGQTLFEDDFSTLDTQKWQPIVRISGEDGEFVTYTKKQKNIFVEDDKLVIKPTLVPDNYVKYGRLDLKGCTGEPNSVDCVSEAKSYNILPPVESGQICSNKSFNFRYGVITIRAKLPKGDWVVPQIWLKPVREVYGKGYLSGKLMLVSARGNAELISPEGNDIGAKVVESGFQVGTEPYWNIIDKKEILIGSDPWNDDFHNYTYTWTPDTLLFYVDGNVLSGLKTLYRISERSLLEELGIKKETRWANGNIVAPFDEDFYLCIGVSVGGMRHFPDDSISNGVLKPWNNKDIKNRLQFFLNKQSWEPTWNNDTRLEIESIKVVAY